MGLDFSVWSFTVQKEKQLPGIKWSTYEVTHFTLGFLVSYFHAKVWKSAAVLRARAIPGKYYFKKKEISKGREAAWAHGTSLKWWVHDLPWMLLKLYLLCLANNISGVDHRMIEVSKNWTQKCSCCPTSAKQRWRLTSLHLLVWGCFARSWSSCCPSGHQTAFQPASACSGAWG